MKQSMDIILLLEAWKGDNTTRRIAKLNLNEPKDFKDLVEWLPKPESTHWTAEDETALQAVLEAHTILAVEEIYKLPLLQVKLSMDACGEVPIYDNEYEYDENPEGKENGPLLYFSIGVHVHWDH